jgi:hypothetical protein
LRHAAAAARDQTGCRSPFVPPSPSINSAGVKGEEAMDVVTCDVCRLPLTRPGDSKRTVHPACGLVVIGQTALVIPTTDEIERFTRSVDGS